MDYLNHNRKAWDLEVDQGNPWTQPVSSETIQKARQGDWTIILTPVKPVPTGWFPKLDGCRTLCLASGGGQQGPLLAAAGAKVTVFDNSPKQLDRDREVSQREGLDITCVQGDMADLSAFANDSFDFIVHPVSNCFVPNVRPVWKEAFRVLASGGTMIAGMCNPIAFLFDENKKKNGQIDLKFSVPYSDIKCLTEAERAELFGANSPVEWGHSLDDQIGGQLAAGFHLTGFYEDRWASDEDDPLNPYFPSFFATRGWKP